MRRPEIEALEDYLDDDALTTSWDVGLPEPLASGLEPAIDADEPFGLRRLYEAPEILLRTAP